MRVKKVMALMLSSVMIFSTVPGEVLAAEEVPTEFTDGVEDLEEKFSAEPSKDGEDLSDKNSEDLATKTEIKDELNSVNANDNVVESGICGDDVRYTVTKNDDSCGYTLTIDGNGAMYKYNTPHQWVPWTYSPYKSQITCVIIQNNVTTIARSAFFEFSNLTDITIPGSVTDIGQGAFGSCSSLINIVIPDGITSIEAATFYGCNSLTNIVIPQSVDEIGTAAFYGCSSLKNIVIPPNVTSIKDSVFYGCSNLTSITIPKNVTSIWPAAFSGCSNLSNITIPKSVMSIGNDAFYGSGLRNIKYIGSKEQWDKLDVSLQDINYATVSFHEHSYESYIIRNATCTETGSKKWICNLCGDFYIEEIKTIDHKEAKDDAVRATCTRTGKTEGSHCSVCGKVLTIQKTIAAKGHLWSEWRVVSEPMGALDGLEQRTCMRCGKSESRNISPTIIPVPTMPEPTATPKPELAEKEFKITENSYEGIYDGKNHAEGLISLEEKPETDYKIYYSIDKELNEKNYSILGSQSLPNCKNVNDYTLYYYIVAFGYKSKAGSVSVQIEPRNIEEKTVKLPYESTEYTGKYITPYTMIDGLTWNVDYSLEYVDNKQPGIAKIIITGMGNYKGTLEKTFEITKMKQNIKADKIPVYYEKGKTFNLNAASDGPGLLSYTSSDENVVKVDE
ncbi:MAG: leucine-rich repeat domain-containing protein, partial [Eubacteriales bacterium]|nr:leucine-rich repeat domain-containing protein [Eubacteriales bacterium]